MLEAEEKLDLALRAGSADERARRQRIRWIYYTAASYALDVLFLVLYAATGTIPMYLASAYGAVAATACAISFHAYAKGWNLRLRDPNLTQPLILLAIVLQLGVVVAAPQLAFPFLANL